jgi:hypothetical protein
MWVSEADILKILGPEKSAALIRIYGGRKLYIPAKPAKNHSIAETVGFLGMAALCREFGGFKICIANARSQNSKKAQIMELIDQGLSLSKIAELMEVTMRYVSMVKKEYRQAS